MLYVFGANPLVVALAATILLILTVMPRIFVNVNKLPYQLIGNKESQNRQYVLVTGGGGFIGTELVDQLLKKNYKVRVLDKFIYGKEVFDTISNKKNLDLVMGDITDPFILTKALIDVKAVIHLAGIVGEPAAAIDEKLTRHANIVSTRILKESVKAFNIPRFLFASTTAVYESSLSMVNERSKTNPSLIYTKTKLDSEKELLYDTHDSFHPTVLRISTAFGHSRKPKFDLVANLFVAQAFFNREIHVINGNQWRSFVHVSDIADAFVHALEAPLEKVSRQIINVGNSSQRIQLKDLAQLVQATLKDELNPRISYETKGTGSNHKISFSKLKRTLRVSSLYSLEDGIWEVYGHLQKGTYQKHYTDPYYSSYEAAKLVMKEFYTEDYRSKHYSTLS